MEKAKKIAIPIIAIICVLAIIYLLFFFGKNVAPSSELTTAIQKEYTISFDTDELMYSNGVDFMDGVTALDENGENLSSFVTVSCKPTKNISTKILTYSINKSGYKISTFERKLILDSSYTGPSIEISGDGIEVPLDQVKNLSSILSTSNMITTDDGFGATCSITAAIQSQEEITIGDYVATVTAQNIFGDTADTKTTITVVSPESSIIKLSATSVTINKGDSFNPIDYVLSCYDEAYGDLLPYVVADNIDTSKSGIYTIEYKIEGMTELENEISYLYVTVN